MKDARRINPMPGLPRFLIEKVTNTMTNKHLSASTVDQLLKINAEIVAISALENPSAEDERRADVLYGQFTRLARESGADRSSQRAELVGGTVESGTPYAAYSGDLSRQTSDAHRVVDTAVRSGLLADSGAECVTGLIERGSPADRSRGAHWARVAGDPAYLTAFAKVLGNPARGDMLWTPQERAAVQAVEEFRAMALSPDTAGGFMVPLTLDPAITITNAGATSVLREVSRVVTTLTDSWNGVTSAGVTSHFHAEAAEMADDSPVLAQPTVPLHRLDSFIPFSFEVEADAVGFVQEMTRLMLDSAQVRETEAFVTGTGSGEPEGLITGLAGGSSVVTGAGEAFTAANVFAVQAALPPRFQANARWMGNVAVLNAIAQFETTNGARAFPEASGIPAALLRKPLDELSPLDATINPAATESNYSLIYGDFAAGFVIADRVGAVVELVPHLFGNANRPTGQRGLIMWQRVGSKVVAPNAFRVLNVPTTA